MTSEIGVESIPVRLGDFVEIKHGWPFKSEFFSEELSGRPIIVNIGNDHADGRYLSETTDVCAWIVEEFCLGLCRKEQSRSHPHKLFHRGAVACAIPRHLRQTLPLGPRHEAGVVDQRAGAQADVHGRGHAAAGYWLQANFDFTIIDCPPSMPIQVQMMVKVSDSYVVPTIPDKLSVRGCDYLLDRLHRKHFTITGLGTLWSLYREQSSVHRAMIDLVNDRPDLYPGIPEAFETIIPNANAIARAMESSSGSLNVKYTTEFANKYRQLVGEIVQRCDATARAN